MPDAPSPLRLDVLVSVSVRCSGPECLVGYTIPSLPLVMPTVDSPLILDRREVASAMPEGWKVGAMRPVGLGLLLKDGPPLDAKPMPVVFCPSCAAKAGAPT